MKYPFQGFAAQTVWTLIAIAVGVVVMRVVVQML